ncbi:putative transcriptional regulator [Methanococcus voltae]|uniref:Rrf2 family transcriptional regulator n=1 Tax=Methanococcus voltae TaxID=2188 RepID=UPI001AE5F961|nr:Rrf2 family transcriptional regulator [Methanococcus voltae]MBP2144022.1 putative transcriptional regulator [Methanococcus voltae]
MEVTGKTLEIMQAIEGICTTKEVAEKLETHPKNIDRHIRVLRDLGLVETRKGKFGGICLTNEGKYLLKKKHINLISIKVRIVANDKIGLLAEITSTISEKGGNILATTLEKEDERVVVWLSLENLDFDDLKRILKDKVIKVSLV